jgi:hypothetical protein
LYWAHENTFQRIFFQLFVLKAGIYYTATFIFISSPNGCVKLEIEQQPERAKSGKEEEKYYQPAIPSRVYTKRGKRSIEGSSSGGETEFLSPAKVLIAASWRNPCKLLLPFEVPSTVGE